MQSYSLSYSKVILFTEYNTIFLCLKDSLAGMERHLGWANLLWGYVSGHLCDLSSAVREMQIAYDFHAHCQTLID